MLTPAISDFVFGTPACNGRPSRHVFIIHQLYFTKTGRDKKNNKTDKKNLTRKT